MTELNSNDDLELTDVLLQLNESGACKDSVKASADMMASADIHDCAAGNQEIVVDANESDAVIALLRKQLAAARTALDEREQALLIEQQRMQELRQQLAAAADKADGRAKNPFDMMLTLSSEREAALRERKLYKDRASNAESTVAQLESDLAAAHANAKVQAERAGKYIARCDDLQKRVDALQNDKHAYEKQIAILQAPGGKTTTDAEQGPPQTDEALVTLRQLLRVRDNRIAELEGLLSDRLGAPTLIGGELERLAMSAFPAVTHALESLDVPGEVHKLVRGTTTIGRSAGNDITLDSPSISRFHARLQSKPEGMWLFDLRSVNGVQVNDHRISSQLLNEGDMVTIGEHRFKFSSVQSPQSVATPVVEQV